MSEREQTSLVREFNESNSVDIQLPSKTEDTFVIPTRNWNGLIDSYNSSHKKKFELTALECKSIIEYIKRGNPAMGLFKAFGISKSRFSTFAQNAVDLEEQFELLRNKENLSEEEESEFHDLLRHPLRILMSDIIRAEGVADVLLWEKFNEKAIGGNNELLLTIMKARFKEIFSEKTPEATSTNIQINVSAGWVDKLVE